MLNWKRSLSMLAMTAILGTLAPAAAEGMEQTMQEPLLRHLPAQMQLRLQLLLQAVNLSSFVLCGGAPSRVTKLPWRRWICIRRTIRM